MSGGRRRPLLPLIVLPVVLYIALMAALAIFVVHPPLLGWIGLAVAALIALLATALAITFFSRMRTNAARLHPEGAGNPICGYHAAVLYSWMRPPSRSRDAKRVSRPRSRRLIGNATQPIRRRV
jgi:hypothetical protein